VDAFDHARSKMVWGECPDIDRVTVTDHANRQSRTRNCEQTKHQRRSLQLDDGAVFAKDHDE
jgi:hypothetical protein